MSIVKVVFRQILRFYIANIRFKYNETETVLKGEQILEEILFSSNDYLEILGYGRRILIIHNEIAERIFIKSQSY